MKGVTAWLCDEVEDRYPNSTGLARKLLFPFPSSYSVECGFSIVDNLLLKKRNSLDITKRGDLRLKLTGFVRNIEVLCSEHQPQNSH